MRGRESRWARAVPWRERGGSEREHEEERVDFTVKRRVPKRIGRASKESLSRGNRMKRERVSGRKSSPGRSAESWPHSMSGQTCDGKGGWEAKSPLIRKKSKMGQGDSSGRKKPRREEVG